MLDTRSRRLKKSLGISPGGALFRRLAYVGSRYGPRAWVRYSPPLFGLAFAAALPEKRAIVRDNLRRVLGVRGVVEEQLDVARTFCSYAHCLAEALAAERPEALSARHRVCGEAHLRDVAAQSGGFVVVTAHTGAWDTAARLLAQDVGREVIVVMEPEADPRARQLHDAVRTRHQVKVAHIEHPLDALPLLRHLRAGGVIAVQLDRLPRQARSVQVSLFGEPFVVPEGPFQLAATAGCPVLPVFARRAGFFEYEVDVRPPIVLPRRPDEQALRAAARQACAEMQRFLFAHPTQWFHFERGPGA